MHEDEAISLVGRALARVRFPDLGFADPAAEELLATLDLDPDRFDERRLRAATVRTMVVDDLVRAFFERHPSGLAVSLFPGLCTRFSRVDNGALRWLEIEDPQLAAFKCRCVQPSDRHVVAPSGAVGGYAERLRDIRKAHDGPAVLIVQGGVLGILADARDAFLMEAVQHLPSGAELVIDYDVRAPLRPSSGKERASLEAIDGAGEWVRYPRVRFVRSHEYAVRLEHDLAGLNAVSRLFRGRGVPSVAHLRFV